jgi:hypothetical protein
MYATKKDLILIWSLSIMLISSIILEIEESDNKYINIQWLSEYY